MLCARVAARLAAPTPVGGALRGRPRLVMRRDDHKNDHYERSSRKEQHYGGGAHDGPVPACPPLLLLQRNSRRVRWTIAGGRIVQLYPGDPTPRATEKNHDASCRQRTRPHSTHGPDALAGRRRGPGRRRGQRRGRRLMSTVAARLALWLTSTTRAVCLAWKFAGGAPGARTLNPRIKSPLLCH